MGADGNDRSETARTLIESLAAGRETEVKRVTDGASPADLRGMWRELTEQFGRFEGIDGVEQSDERTVSVAFELSGGEFDARVEFDENGAVTDCTIRMDDGGITTLVWLVVARVRGVLAKLSPFDDSRTETAETLVELLDEGRYEAAHASLSPVSRSALSVDQFETNMSAIWESKIGTVERIERIERVDDEVFVVVHGTAGRVRVLVSLAPDGEPSGVTLGTPEQGARMVAGRLRNEQFGDLSELFSGDVAVDPTAVEDAWESVHERVGAVEEVGDPRSEERGLVTVPITATAGEFTLRVEFDELLRTERAVATRDGDQLMQIGRE